MLSLIPLFGIAIKIYLGLKGKELAWKAKEWRNVEHFLSVQKKWNIAAMLLLLPYIGMYISVMLPAYQEYVEKAKQQAGLNQVAYKRQNTLIHSDPVTETSESAPEPVEAAALAAPPDEQDIVVDAADMPISRGLFFFDSDLSGNYYVSLYPDSWLDIKLNNGSRSFRAKRLEIVNYSNKSGFTYGVEVKTTCRHIVIKSEADGPPKFICFEPVIIGESRQIRAAQDNRSQDTESGYSRAEYDQCIKYAEERNIANPPEHCACVLNSAAKLFADKPNYLTIRFWALLNPKHEAIKYIRDKCGESYLDYFDKKSPERTKTTFDNDTASLDDAPKEAMKLNVAHLAGPANAITVSKLAELNSCGNAAIVEVIPAAGYSAYYDVNCPNKSILRVRCRQDKCFVADVVNANVK